MRRAASILGISVLSATLGGCHTAQPARPTAELWSQTRTAAAMQLADDHVNEGRFDRARTLLASHQDANDCRMQMMLVRIDLEQGSYLAASQRLDAIVESCSGSAEFADARGLAFEGLGRWSDAAGAYQLAYAAEANVSRLVAWLDALVSSDEVERARSVLDAERWRFPGETMLHETAARLCLHAGDPEAAVNELATALLANMEDVRLRTRLAEAYMAAGQHTKAIPLWSALIRELEATTARRQARLRLAVCQVEAGEYHDAAHTYRVLTLTDTDDVAALVGLAATTLADHRPAETVEAAQRALRLRPEDRDARLALACGYARLRQPGKAIDTLAISDVDAIDDPLVRELLTRWRGE